MLDPTDPFRIYVREKIKKIRGLIMNTSPEVLGDIQRRKTAIETLLAQMPPELFPKILTEMRLLDQDVAAIQLLKKGCSTDNAIKTAEEIAEELYRRLELFTGGNDVFRDNTRLLYQEAGQWARHFSSVRMTVMTFTITACTAIVAFLWKNGAPSVSLGQSVNIGDSLAVDAVAILWILGSSVFSLFTIATYSQIRRQQLKRPALATGPLGFSKPRPLPIEWTSLLIGLLAAFLAWIGCHWELGLIDGLKWVLWIPVAFQFVVFLKLWLWRQP